MMKSWSKRTGALAMSALMGASVLASFAISGGTASATQGAVAGEGSYVSLHQYISPTDDPLVYKVRLTVKGTFDPTARTEVVVAMDTSQSLNFDPTGKQYSSIPGNDDAWGFGSGIAGMADPAYWLYPLDDTTYLKQSDHQTAYTGGDYFGTMAIPYDNGVNPRTTGAYAAAQGLKYAVNTFTDPSNVRSQNTYLGFVTYSGPDDTVNDPYMDADYVNGVGGFMGPGNYGFGANVYAQSPSMAVDTGTDFYANAVRYSTRLIYDTSQDGQGPAALPDVSADSLYYDMYTTSGLFNLPGMMPTWATTSVMGKYFSGLETRATDLPEMSQTYAGAGKSTFTQGGLISAKYKDALLEDMTENIRAATYDGQYTQMVYGMDEAARIFFGHGQRNAIPNLYQNGQNGAVVADPSVGYLGSNSGDIEDDIRRYVILLSDGFENDPFSGGYDFAPGKTMQLINRMKNQGVEFFVIALAPSGSSKTNDYNSVSYLQSVAATDDPGLGGSDMAVWLGMIASKFQYDDEFDMPLGSPGYVDNATAVQLDAGAIVDNEAFPAANFGGGLPVYGTWAAAVTDYTGTVNATGASVAISPTANKIIPSKESYDNFIYVENGDTAAITAAFKTFVDIINSMGKNATTNFGFGENFEIYQMPGQPLLWCNNDEFDGQIAEYKNGKVNWVSTKGLPLNTELQLVFYVKMDADFAKNNVFSSVLTNVTFTAEGRFKPTGGSTRKPWKWTTIKTTYPDAKVSGDGSIQQAEADKLAADQATEEKKENLILPITGGMGNTRANATPKITGIESAQTKSGRTQVTVKVENNSDLYYQWQWLDGEKWVDIAGANSSVYTLGKQFKVGTEYSLRCEISNYNNKKFYSETIKVKASSAKISEEGLVSSGK